VSSKIQDHLHKKAAMSYRLPDYFNLIVFTYRANMKKLTSFGSDLDELKTVLESACKLAEELEGKIASASSRLEGDDENLRKSLQVSQVYKILIEMYGMYV